MIPNEPMANDEKLNDNSPSQKRQVSGVIGLLTLFS